MHTFETRKKISEATKGRIPWNKGLAFMKGKNNPFFGKKHKPETIEKMRQIKLGKKLSIETKRKISEGHKGIKQSEEWRKNKVAGNLGSNHWNWKGGITSSMTKLRFSVEGKRWTKDCMVRDNFTCQKCKILNGLGKTVYLQVHHILNFAEYPELRFVVNNGITFCKKCHKDFHSKYGIKRNTEAQVIEFLNSKL